VYLELLEEAEVCRAPADRAAVGGSALRARRRLDAQLLHSPPWRQPRGKSMVYLVNSHTNATRIGWYLWEIDLRFAPGLPPGLARSNCAWTAPEREGSGLGVAGFYGDA